MSSRTLPQWLPSRPDVPGIALPMVVGLSALFLTAVLPRSPLVSDVLFALLLGAVILNTPLRRVIRLAPPTTEREPDRYAPGMRFTGKWVLRAGIILMGLKVQTSFFGRTELALIVGVAAAAIPSAFFIAHTLGARLGVRRPLVDVLAGGTMICGASAVNAIAPVAGARREEQGLAIGVVFLFSVVALLTFRPIAFLIGLDPSFAGLWSGLAVNDLSSAMAVGSQMGGDGGVMAAASKSARVLMLAPTLVTLSLLRRPPRITQGTQGGKGRGEKAEREGILHTIVEQLPGFLLGYLGLAVLRAAGDRLLGAHHAWEGMLALDRFLVDLCMVTVSAGIGLHLDLRKLLAAGAPAMAVGGGASVWMAGLTLAMVAAVARGAPSAAALIGVLGVLGSYGAYRLSTAAEAETRRLRARFESGAPLSLVEATQILDATEHEGALEDGMLRRILAQLYPSIGELIPVRESPLPHGEGCRWVTFWEGKTGWALVAVCREPGSATPIHAHPHRLLGKAIEGVLEELRFAEDAPGELTLTTRQLLAHNDLVETDGLSTLHVVRAAGPGPAIDLQLRGPEVGSPGRRLRTLTPIDLSTIAVGTRFQASEEVDDRPGQGGEGARAGRAPAPPPA